MAMTSELTTEQSAAAANLNDRQLAFANQVLAKPVHGMTDSQCYQQAGYNSNSEGAAEVCAAKLLSNAKLLAYLTVMRDTAVESAGYTLDRIIGQLSEVARIGLTMKKDAHDNDVPINLAAVISAMTELNKMQGNYAATQPVALRPPVVREDDPWIAEMMGRINN